MGSQILENKLTNLFAGNMRCRERRRTELCELNVVETGYRHVFGYPNALIAKLPQNSDRHEIIDADYRSWLEAGGKQLASCLTPSFQAVCPGNNVSFRAWRTVRYGFQEGLPAFADRPQGGVMSHESHSRMAEGVEILDDFLHSFSVVYPDVRDVPPGCSHVVKYDWNVGIGQNLHKIRVHFGNDRSRAGHTRANHQAGAGHQLFGAVVRVRNNHLITARVRRRFKSPKNIEKKRVFHVRDENSQGAVFAPSEGARMQVWIILQLLSCF